MVAELSSNVLSLCKSIDDLYKELETTTDIEDNLVKIIYLDLRVGALGQKVRDELNKSNDSIKIEILEQQLAVLKAEKALLRNLERNIKDLGKIKSLVEQRKLLDDVGNFKKELDDAARSEKGNYNIG